MVVAPAPLSREPAAAFADAVQDWHGQAERVARSFSAWSCTPPLVRALYPGAVRHFDDVKLFIAYGTPKPLPDRRPNVVSMRTPAHPYSATATLPKTQRALAVAT